MANPHAIRLQLKWHHQFQFAGYYAAAKLGYYAAADLEVEIIEGCPSRPPVPTVLAGDADFGVSDAEVVLHRMRGAPIVVCAAIFQHSPYVIISLGEPGLRSPHELVGKTVMLADDQGSAQFYAMLRGEGIDPASVRIVPQVWTFDDLMAGRVDAMSGYATVEPALLRARGLNPTMIRGLDYGIDFYGDTLFTTEAYLKKHPKRVRDFVEASQKGWSYAMEHPEEMAEWILQLPGVRERGITKEHLLAEAEAMKPYILSEVVEIGHMNPGRWRRIADIFASQGLAPKLKSIQGFIYDPTTEVDSAWIQRLGWLILIILIGVVLTMIWTLQVRREVAERTKALREEVKRRESAEESIRNLNQRLELALTGSGFGVWEFDLQSSTLQWDDTMFRIYGVDSRTWDGAVERWKALLHEDDRARVDAAFNDLLAGRRVDQLIMRIQRAGDGELRWIEANGYLQTDSTGKSQRLVGMNRDITERKRMEEQFLRTQRMESIGTLAGGLAHDLNNLLTPILMGTGLLRQLDLRPEANEVVQNMGESAKRGSELVRQILSFARGMDGDRVCISLDSLVHDIERMIVNTFPKNIQVENTVGKGLWPVLGDPTQLNQVLLNLCVNARDAMPGGGQLRLSARNCEEHSPLGGSLGPHVVLEVSDTGEGMSQEIQERIFEPFFTTKPIGSGTGLGLSTVLGIVRSHGGFINVSSRPGLGTKFEIHLPASQSGVETTAKPDLEPVLPRGNGECILIVDDEQSILAVASEILRSFGYRTLTCEDGNHALTEFQGSSSEIRLVVTDLMMPALDGPTLIRQLRHRNPDLPIVAMSGLLTESSSLPADIRFLSKPFTAKTLLLVVAESLREGHTRVAPVGKGISAR